MLKYTISSCFVLFSLFAVGQESSKKRNDSIPLKKKYGFRIGVDISKPIISSTKSAFRGFEIVGDYRLKKRLYLAGELGYVKKTSEEDSYNFTTKGYFINMGININAFKNWLEMDNEIYYGFRYGFSQFSQTLKNYTIFQNGTSIDGFSSSYFEPRISISNQKYSNQTAHWATLVFGIKAETFKNLYFGIHVGINKIIYATKPDNFENLYIPGFGKVYTTKSSISFNYTISYRIPLYKK